MSFTSLSFLALFAIAVAAVQLRAPWSLRKGVLLGLSYLFYAAWNPPFVCLLWLSTTIDFLVGRKLATTDNVGTQRALLVVSLVTNLGLLAAFKYASFFAQTVGLEVPEVIRSVVLPVGISFYTFQTLSYTIDIYRGAREPSSSPLDFALYVTFFPQLVAGPIVRSDAFLPQLEGPTARPLLERLELGLTLMVLGVFQKSVLADGLFAPVVEEVFGKTHALSALDAWAGICAFTGQIFCDFAGYSTIAIGAAACLGFHLPDNFRFPYAARGFSDFWQRWHITLSSWLRDYLYIPLGGNRAGAARTLANLVVTMFLGGLWHGASWTFVVWGLLHGLFLVVERTFARATRFRPPALAQEFITLFFVALAWVFFRADTFSDAARVLRGAFTSAGETLLSAGQLGAAFAGLLVLVVVHHLMREVDLRKRLTSSPVRGFLIGLGLVITLWASGADRAFIYFQF